MKPAYSISIPKPCTEKWENFTKTADGGFCGSCNKVVVDFTRMTDEEIITFFKKQPANTCGRFKTSQLKSYSELALPRVNPNLMFLRAGVLSLFLLGANAVAMAQSEKPAKGMVLSKEEKVVLPGVNVVLKGTSIGTVTDLGGMFEFPSKLKEGDVLVFSFIGCTTEEYKVKKTDGDLIEVALEMDYEVTLGAVVVAGNVYVEKNNLWTRLKRIFRS